MANIKNKQKDDIKKTILYLEPNTDKRCENFDIFYKGEEIQAKIAYATLEIITDERVEPKLCGEFLKDFQKELGIKSKKEVKNVRKRKKG